MRSSVLYRAPAKIAVREWICGWQRKSEVICMSKQNTFIYGTSNPAKLRSMQDCLAPLDIEIIGLKENGLDIPDVEEIGNTPLENARIKALAYYNALKRPVFACDSELYINGLTDKEQPGVHVRLVNGKRLNDDEMVTYYAGIAAKMGGKAVARYKNAICLIINDDEIYEHFGDDISGEAFCIVDKPHPQCIEGFPLDCISVHIESGDYYYWQDRDNDAGMMNKGFQKFFRTVLTYRNIKIRSYHPDDCKAVWELFYDAIHSINAADYPDSQLDAWASKEMDLHTWNERLLRNDYAVVAELNDVIVGIGAADDTGYSDLLYVHKNYQRMGIATLIADEIDEYLRSKGVKAISTDASITAKPFFEKRGYVVQKELSVECRGQFLTNFKMQTLLGNETVNTLKAIFEKHKKEKVCVVGTMCCGKTTLIKQLSGYNCIDMDDEFWPQASEAEIEFYSQRPFTKDMSDSLYGLFNDRLSVKAGHPLFGVYILNCDVVVYLDISEKLLKEHCEKRNDTDFIDVFNLKKWIEEDLNIYKKNNDKTFYDVLLTE